MEYNLIYESAWTVKTIPLNEILRFEVDGIFIRAYLLDSEYSLTLSSATIQDMIELCPVSLEDQLNEQLSLNSHDIDLTTIEVV